MIIDLILDRYNNTAYNAHDFYIDVLDYENIDSLGHNISIALDYGSNEDVQKAICDYIDRNEYNANIKRFVCAVDWLNNDYSDTDYSVLYPLCDTSGVIHDYTDTEHCKKCVKCAAIAYSKISDINPDKIITEKVKEVFPESFMKQIQVNLSESISKIIDSI